MFTKDKEKKKKKKLHTSVDLKRNKAQNFTPEDMDTHCHQVQKTAKKLPLQFHKTALQQSAWTAEKISAITHTIVSFHAVNKSNLKFDN